MLKRTETVARAVNTMDEEKKRQMERVFIARKRANRNTDDDMIEAVKHHKTGAMLTTAEEVYKDILEYNVEVMEKGDNTTEESKRLRREKIKVIEEHERIDSEESEEPIKCNNLM